MRRQTSAKETNAQTEHNRTKRLMVESADRHPPPKQQKAAWAEQRQQRLWQRRLESDFISVTVRNIPHRICKTASKFEKEILKNGRCSSRSFEYAECGYFTLLFCKERQRNEQRITTHRLAALPLHSLPLPLRLSCLFENSLKPNKRQNNEQPNEHNSNESPREQNDGWECRKHFCYKASFENQTI